ncbi:hypothetical protein [Flavobacterium anhuiense]|uniref:hypothetical protein n=1 Tax=Flavobacterium anhuiense TaxID=459526 RepID=UPI003D9867B5
MKKLFLWYSGTGTEAENMRDFFNIAETDTIKVEYINGLGTKGNLSATKTLLDKKPSYLDGIFDLWNQTKTLAFGSEEHDQLAQIEHFFNIINKIDSNDKEVELIIGGHSRGAAVGILGFIASLRETCKRDSFENSPIKKITFIAVDPVPGSSKVRNLEFLGSKNDLLGFETIEGENKIKSALDFIAAKSKKPNLFKVIYFPARFDARNEFKADQYWLDFYESQRNSLSVANPKNNEPVIETKFYIAGFRHSAMVDKNDEISELYDAVNCPTNLLKEIVKHELEISNSDLNAIQKGIIKIETNALLNLASNVKNLKLTERTTKNSYNSIPYEGESLENIIKNNSLTSTIRTNNRYLY